MNGKIIFLLAALAGGGTWSALPQTSKPAAAGTEVGEKTKSCFECKGKGEAKCPEVSCRSGAKDCPGPCLKLTKGVWEKRNVPGHTDPNERWQKVTSGRRSGYWSSAHVGEVPILAADGTAASPKCTVCGGAATVTCPRCKGKGTGVCTLCDGKKSVPESWSAFDHPKMKNRPQKFSLKDGRTIIGRKVMISGDTVTLRTADGDVKVNSGDITSETAQPTAR
jgi:hypothetical protein